MTTRRAFIESLGLALGVGVVAKAAVSRPEEPLGASVAQIVPPFGDGWRTPDGSRITALTPVNGELLITTTSGIYVLQEGDVVGPIYGKRRSEKIGRRIATTSQRVRVP